MRSQFGNVVYIEVDGNEGAVCGFAPNCKELILFVFPGINREVLEREDFRTMIDEVDNVTGALYVMKPKVGNPLIMNSTLESLQKEYDEWLERTSQQDSSQ